MKHNYVQKAVVYAAIGFDYSSPLFKEIKNKSLSQINYLYKLEIFKRLKQKKISVDGDIVSLYLLINYRTGTTEETLLRRLWEYDDNVASLDHKLKKLNQFLTLIELPIFELSAKELIELQAKPFPQNE